MQIRPFSDTPLKTIVNCFNTAFADYIIPFQVEVEAMGKRWQSCRVDYGLSYGAFDREQLVGFIINGVDQWQGKKTAYNCGTGVIPSHRGQRIVQQLYDAAFPAFREQGIGQCTLEVIIGNDRAIRAYEGVGFRKDRRLKCFARAADVVLKPIDQYRIQRAATARWKAYQKLVEFHPSWESQPAAYEVLRADCAIWELYSEQDLAGYIIVKPDSGHVLQFGMADRPDWKLIGQQLWRHVIDGIPGLRMNNVDSRAGRSLAVLRAVGMQPTLDQWEMRRLI